MSLQETIRKVLKEYLTESELTEKCWPGYTQKGMKTMFGKDIQIVLKRKRNEPKRIYKKSIKGNT